MVSEIKPGQTISRCPTAHPDTMGENNTPTALKGCEVKSTCKVHYVGYFSTLWMTLKVEFQGQISARL